MDTIFQIIILVISVVFHEVAHGYAAVLLGDPTPRYANRLTINPLRHIDPIGSVIVPLLLALSQSGFMFGWAKPVPINTYNLKGRWGEALVAAAGPGANLLVALVFGLLLRFAGLSLGAGVTLAVSIIVVNLYLALFNLVPLPPLDGSRLLLSFLPHHASGIRAFLDRYGLILVLGFAFFFAHLIVPVVMFLFTAITGIAL